MDYMVHNPEGQALSHDFTMATYSEHAHYITKWRVSDTPTTIMRRTHPLLRNCRDNAKLACHCTARYKIEWIYTRTKVRGPDSLELALEMRKKERKKERRKIDKWPIF